MLMPASQCVQARENSFVSMEDYRNERTGELAGGDCRIFLYYFPGALGLFLLLARKYGSMRGGNFASVSFLVNGGFRKNVCFR